MKIQMYMKAIDVLLLFVFSFCLSCNESEELNLKEYTSKLHAHFSKSGLDGETILNTRGDVYYIRTSDSCSFSTILNFSHFDSLDTGCGVSKKEVMLKISFLKQWDLDGIDLNEGVTMFYLNSDHPIVQTHFASKSVEGSKFQVALALGNSSSALPEKFKNYLVKSIDEHWSLVSMLDESQADCEVVDR